MLKIAIIIGSTRPGRKGETVGKWAYDIARKRNDAEFELVDIADFNLPLLDEPMPPMFEVEGRREQFQTAPGKSFSGLLGLQSLDILQEGLLMAFGLDVLVDLAEGTIGVDDKAGAIPVHRTFVLALPHPRRL